MSSSSPRSIPPASRWRLKWLLALAPPLATVAPCRAQDRDEAATGLASTDVVALGRRLFMEETFDGNGRVCGTCHLPDGFGTITPEFVRRLYESDPDAPLFRAIDSDDGLGVSYERLKEHATVRIPIEPPTRTVTGLGVRKCDDPTNTSVVRCSRFQRFGASQTLLPTFTTTRQKT